MDEKTEIIPPVEKSRLSGIAGPALFVGCFVIWPAATVASSYLGLRQTQTALEVAKVVASFKS